MKPPIRVAYVLTPITFGGAERVSLHFLSNVDRNEIDLHLIALVRPWEEPPMLLDEVNRLGISYSTLPVAARPGNDPLRVFRVIWGLYRIFRQQSFDLLHTHGYFADICALPIAKLNRIRWLSTCHGFISTDRKLRLYNRVDLWVLRLCDRVIAVSDGIYEVLKGHGIDEDKITVITNAVPILSPATEDKWDPCNFRQQHGISKEAFVFAYVGRLSEEKGLHYLLDAMAELTRSYNRVRLILVGDGSQRKMLEQRAVELNLKQHISFVGFQKDVLPWLSIADCFVLPSLTEGTPMVVLEAMAAGVPVIATRVGGVPDVVADGVNGVLVPCKDVEALQASMSQIIANPQLRENYRREARKTVTSRYSIEPWSQKILHIYQKLCSSNADGK